MVNSHVIRTLRYSEFNLLFPVFSFSMHHSGAYNGATCVSFSLLWLATITLAGTGSEVIHAPKADQPLLDYVFTRLTINKISEPEVFITAMEWVSSQWKHDGMNEAPYTMISLDILKKVRSEGMGSE
jgi:hypothetical protein